MNRLTIYLCRDCGCAATIHQQQGFRRTLTQIDCFTPGCLNWKNTQYVENEHGTWEHYMPLGLLEDDMPYLIEMLELAEWMGG